MAEGLNLIVNLNLNLDVALQATAPAHPAGPSCSPAAGHKLVTQGSAVGKLLH